MKLLPIERRRAAKREERRRLHTRACSLCSGPMHEDTKAKDVLRWFRCGRCGRHMSGVQRS